MTDEPVSPSEVTSSAEQNAPRIPAQFLELALFFGILTIFSALAGLIYGNLGLGIGGQANQQFRTIALSAALFWMFLGIVVTYQSVRPPSRAMRQVFQVCLVIVAAVEVLEFIFSVLGSQFVTEDIFVGAGRVIFGSSSQAVSPAAAALIAMGAVALVLLLADPYEPEKTGTNRDRACMLGIAIVIVSFTFVYSYLYGTPLLYGSQYIPIAFFSALSGFFLGFALIGSAGPGAFPTRYMVGNSTTARLFRGFVPLVIGIVILGNFVFGYIAPLLNLHTAIVLSASLVVFVIATALVVSRVSGSIGFALDRAEAELSQRNKTLNVLNEELTVIHEELRQTNETLLTSERQLIRKNEELGAINEELTATEEELRQTNDELARREHEVSAEKERLSSLINSISDEVWFADTHGKYILANPPARKEFGLPPGGSVDIGDLAASLEVYRSDGSKRPQEESPVLRALAGEVIRNEEILVRTPSGQELRNRLVSAAPVRDNLSRIIGSVSVVRDVTELRKAEEAVRKSEERFRSSLDNMIEGCQIIGKDWRYIYINDAAERHNRRPKEELLGERYMDIWPGIESTKVFENIRKCMEEGVCHKMENEFIFPDGASGWFDLRIEAIPDGVFILSMDITERKRIEDVLHTTLSRFYRILSGMDYGVLLVTDNDRVEFSNQAFCDLFGLNQHPEDLVDISTDRMLDLIRPAYGDPDGAISRVREIVRENKPVKGEDVHMRDGRTFLRSFVPLKIDEQSYGRLWVHIDITERKSLETAITARAAELLQKNTDLNALNEELTGTQEELNQNLEELCNREQELSAALAEKEVLLSEIHHRVKNNLTAFISLLSLEGATDNTPAGKTLLLDLQNRARSMALIHETLYKTHKFDKVDMGDYLSTLIGQVTHSLGTLRPIKTEVNADGLMLDLHRATPLGLIVNELVTNSFKYAFPQSFDVQSVRGAPPAITITLTRCDGSYALSFSDNGVGLPREIDLATTKTLGLKLVNFLAKHQLQATVDVNTRNGTELVFRFRENDR